MRFRSDLKLDVLDTIGHADHGSRRLGAALRKLKGPADQLTQFLRGLDAPALMALAPPDDGYCVVYETEQQPAATALRQELQAMRLRELRKRARDSGVDADALEETTSASDQKGAVIALLLEHTAANAVADTSSTAHLHAMSLKDVRALAREAGVDEDALEDTMDMEDPKGAVIALIVAAKSVVRSDRPHFGSRSSPSQSSEQGKPRAASADRSAAPAHQSTKHVMLSYQWDNQRQVTKVHELLTKLGVACWMDIHGGMGTDVYESMAEGVSNASVVVCFMSQAYQDSPNCRLELKFAQQSGVEIIPVMMEGSGWRASGWLGILTAGSLWTRMSDES